MDRGFLNRAFPCGIRQNIGFAVSNFSVCDLTGVVKVTLSCRSEVIAETTANISVVRGETKKAVKLMFCVPLKYAGKELGLSAYFLTEEGIVAKNQWPLWAFDTASDENVRVYLHMDNLTMFRTIKKVFPNAQRLASVDSVIIGCRSWKEPQLAQTAEKEKDTLIISDMYDDVVKDCIRRGCKVLLLDGGKLPDNWMLPPICEELGERDSGRFYTSFRAGWDKGNLVTLVNDDVLLGEFPQDGFCDLHFYDMMQSARIMKPEVIEKEFDCKAKRIISSISKMPAVIRAESIVQDPNAIKEQKSVVKKVFQAREQGYYLKINELLAVCTLKLTDNPPGIALLKETVKCYEQKEQ